jgi:2-methylisocitrate lyase-like PEP mutase family enzyme
MTQSENAAAFRALHHRDHAFIIPNPWDAGTARLLAHLGFSALATTSAGFAFSAGKRDNTISRDESIAHAAVIAAATDLPVSADLENCYARSPNEIAATIQLAAAAGVVGCSIEDMSRAPECAIYPLEVATERVRAAAEAARALPFPFTLTARCENFLAGNPNLADTITRLQSYQQAGADVLYAPGLRSRDDIATVVRSVDRPVNVVMGLSGVQLSLAELSALGVKRVSVGSALSRAALGAFLRAAHELRDHGTFTFAESAIPYSELNDLFP